MLVLNDAIGADSLSEIQRGLGLLPMLDGKATQALFIAGRKSNSQADFDDPLTARLTDTVKQALLANLSFRNYARPQRWARIRFARYGVGDAYDMHVDHPVMTCGEGMMRSDLSFTLFLSSPDSYDGGELMMHGLSDHRAIKLPVGSIVIYPTTKPHRVATVTRGERWVCVGWIQSMIRQEDQRELLFDLSRLRPSLPSGEPRLLLEKSIFNLIRLWAEP